MSRRISVEDLAEYVAPGMALPAKVTFSPDGRWIAWLHSPERTTTRRLFLHQVELGKTVEVPTPAPEVDESTLSLEEKIRRQRTRDLGHGVATFSWSRQNRIIVPTTHSVWAYEPAAGNWTQILEVPDTAIIDPQISPDGGSLAWVQDGELMHCDLAAGSVEALTEPVEPGITHGVADYISQEEFHRMQGFWWSPDSSRIAYSEVDERHIPIYRIAHTNDDPYAFEEHRYPFAGGENPKQKLFVIELSTRENIELDITDVEYVPRVHWSGNESIITELLDRRQAQLELVRHDVTTGGRMSLFTENAESWINVHGHFRSMANGAFLWASERSGHMHLEVRNADGNLRRALTSGDWMVENVAAVDEEGGRVWFTSTAAGATQRHLFVTSLQDGATSQVTTEPGKHRVAVDPEHRYFIDLFGDVETAPTLVLRDLATGEIDRVLFEDVDPRVERFGLQPSQQRTFTTSDGATLHGSLLMPDTPGPFPTLVHVYGGPGFQRVRDDWSMTAELDMQFLRERGVCIVRVDGRGSSGRGVKFESAIKWDLGNIEVRDQAEVVEQLIAEGVVDPTRVAIMGASYGGYMSVMCLAQRPDLFKAAVGQALVSHWDGYDTAYTERYMGLPSENVDGYRRSSLMHHADGIRGQLLLVHGMLDENVHFRHVARLVNTLIQNKTPYEMLLYPDERHAPAGKGDRAHMKSQIMGFLLRELEIDE